MTREQINRDFERFDKLLKVTPLLANRGVRFAGANEFMHMGIQPNGTIGFKHVDTRNYVFMGGRRLHVPLTGRPFERGEF